ncbi:MAG TPA: asparagine synthase (glutamine-hydrolyzing) [Chloroflexota bacterium]|nr:asparagine synthase (glutamine-hydrolyzing) [Chloroflexota bacterium]
MCGIAGAWYRAGEHADALSSTAERMMLSLAHRGPDDRGTWLDAPAGLALAHTRLAIVDLSPAGHQPMISASGRYVISYNGEVFNFKELRHELERQGHAFRGSSDTEVILEGCAAWGVQSTVERLIGQFAFGLWDREQRTLHLVRDRLGIKPLYYAASGNSCFFASELKALRAAPGFPATIDPAAVAEFLRYGYVPTPRSVYAAARKLPPGHLLAIDAAGAMTLTRYWDVERLSGEGQAHPEELRDTEVVDALDSLLRDAVGRRMVADVPLGAFLSGGIDSSLVVAQMQAQSARPIRTFTVGFEEQGYDEAQQARAIATELRTDHTELYVSPREARDVIPNLPDYYDEPFADSSQIPMFLVSQLARRHVTVSLSGDGGDELFAGYNRYFWATRILRQSRRFPRRLRRVGARMIRSVSPAAWNTLAAPVAAPLHLPAVGDKAHKVAAILAEDGLPGIYRCLTEHWPSGIALADPSLADAGRDETSNAVADWPVQGVAGMQLRDQLTYLPDDILTKVDRASMAVALEARVPLLDHRLVELSWRLPPEMKVRDGRGKWALRQVLARYVPPALWERPKMGFGVPLGAWLRGPLRPWAEDLLDERRIAGEGILQPAPIRQCWAEHLAGERNWHSQLWDVLMFEAWLRRWG